MAAERASETPVRGGRGDVGGVTGDSLARTIGPPWCRGSQHEVVEGLSARGGKGISRNRKAARTAGTPGKEGLGPSESGTRK